MKITALLDVLNSALAEPFALAWSQDSPRFLLVLTVVYAVAVIVAVTDQKNTRPGAEHGSAAWGDVFRLNKFYMDKRGPNLLLTQHFHIGIDGYKHMSTAPTTASAFLNTPAHSTPKFLAERSARPSTVSMKMWYCPLSLKC